MTTTPPTPQPADTEMRAAAARSLEHIRTVTAEAARLTILARCEEPWIVQAVRRDGLGCLTFVGRFDLIGADDETLWPALVAMVERVKWNAATSPRIGFVALYVDPEGLVCCVAFDALKVEQYVEPLPLLACVHPVLLLPQGG